MKLLSTTRRKVIGAAVAGAMILALGSTGVPAQAAKNEIVVGSTQGIPQLNPIIRTFAFEETLFPLLWSSLTTWKPDGSVGPQLAKSWKANKAATQWTFTLVKGAKFSDGSALDAKAVKAVFDYAIDEKTVTQERNKIKSITNVRASGDNVIFTLSDPNALFPEAIAWIKMIKVSEVANFNKKPSSSGPYMVSAFSPNESLTMVANPKYFGKKANVKTIKFVKAADPTAAVT